MTIASTAENSKQCSAKTNGKDSHNEFPTLCLCPKSPIGTAQENEPLASPMARSRPIKYWWYKVGLTLVLTNKLLVRKPILNAYFSLSKRVYPCTCIFAYLSGFKKGGAGLGRRAGGVCNLICRSLFHYYGDYSTSTFLLSVCFLYILS
jgi:hypothetical protein